MTPEVALLAGSLALLGTVITVIGGLVLARMLRPNELIDQLQEERKDTRDRLSGLEYRERVRDDYIQTLRQHITEELPPPPPPWPSALGVITTTTTTTTGAT